VKVARQRRVIVNLLSSSFVIELKLDCQMVVSGMFWPWSQINLMVGYKPMSWRMLLICILLIDSVMVIVLVQEQWGYPLLQDQ
jgi:hypothetical protein